MKFAGRALLLAAGCAIAQGRVAAAQPTDLDPGAQLPLAESHTTAKLEPTNPRRLFVLDTAFPAAEAAKTYVLDGTHRGDSGHVQPGVLAELRRLAGRHRALRGGHLLGEAHPRQAQRLHRGARCAHAGGQGGHPTAGRAAADRLEEIQLRCDTRRALRPHLQPRAVDRRDGHRPEGAQARRHHSHPGLRPDLRAGAQPILLAVRRRLDRHRDLR